MTPAINTAKKSKISYTVHEYTHESASQAYGREAAQKLSLPENRVFKTLVVSFSTKEMAVGIIPVSSMLNMKLIAKAAGEKKASMAKPSDVERSTGYVLGGVSPLGQKKRLRTFIDSSAENFSTIYVSAGRRGLEIELNPVDLKKLTNGKFTTLCI